jgi:preprotein translocase subunit SecG
MELALGIVLIVLSLIVCGAVLLQSGKDKGMSGAIGGSTAETFFGKQKGKTVDKWLSTLTIICTTIFSIVVIVMYVIL